MDFDKREDVNKEYTWNLTTRYKNDKAWEKEYDALRKDVHIMEKYQGKLLKKPEILKEALDTYYDYETKIAKLYVYASLKHDEDLKVDKYTMYLTKAYSLYSEFITSCSFIRPEILSGSKTTLNKILKNEKLTKYRFLLEKTIRLKEHTLTKSEEEIVNKLTNNSNVFDKLNSILIDSTLNYGTIKVDGKEVTITNSNYRNIMTNKNRKVRKECYNLMCDKLKEYTSIFGETLVANMKLYSSLADIYHYQSTLDMELFDSNIPKEVVDNLYSVVHKRLNVFQKYLIMLKSNLGLDKLEYYDLQTDFLNNDLTFSIENAEDLIKEATKIYGEKYHKVIEKAFKERWIDYASYKGKRSGAYATSNYGSTPVVLTNFHGKFTDVSAVAHELGHAVNFYLSEEANEAHNYENDIFVAEVASLTNEIILSNYIINHTNNKNYKLLAIYNLIDIIQNNLFDACLEGELENKMYALIDQKEEIDANDLSECILSLRKQYYGKTVELDDKVKYMWARRSHYYNPFYLYQYATGISAAIYIALRIINDQDNMKEKYIDFLSKGDTDYPINLLKNIGVDMTKPEVINNAINYFEYLIDKFNKVSEE